MSDRQITVAGVGAGYFSRFHYESWQRMPQVTPVGACDRDVTRARDTGLPAFENLPDMLTATRPDLLDIILPPVEQAEAIRTALDAGISTVICQKPFCRDLAEARAITKEASTANTQLIIHENFRFQPWYRAIHSALTRGLIGDVLQMTYRLRPGDGQGPRAYLDRQSYFQTMPRFMVHETGVHFIDVFRFLLGDPVAVYADLRRLNPAIAGEDAGYVIFEHEGQARTLLDGNRHLDHATDNLRRTMGEALVEGTSGTLTLIGDGSVTLRRFGETEARVLRAPDTFDGFGGDCVHALQSHVAAALIDTTKPIENTADEYLRVLEIEEAIYASATEGRRIALEAK